ncbi:MAG: carbon-nitrogen hydrolase family protein [Pirellulaceae bacterium]
MSEVKIAGVQMDIQFASLSQNLETVLAKMEEAAQCEAKLIVFPECTLSGYCYSDASEALEHSIDLDDPAFTTLAKRCKDLGVHVVVGFLERDQTRIHNSIACVGPEGVVSSYRKIHLPYLGVDRFTTPGNKISVFKVGGLNIGMNICYDCSFPEPSRVMMLQGADVIILPTNWPSTSGRTADYIPNARAIENHVYFVAINRVGVERGFEFIGKSRIVDPSGKDLACADHRDEEILYATIDCRRPRNKHLVNVPGEHEIDRLRDRRPEVYGPVCEATKSEE